MVNNMNFEQLKEKLKEIGIDSFADGDYNRDDLDVKLDLVYSEGDCEGGGDYSEQVYKYESEKEIIYLKITGFYSSYHGTDWDSEILRVYPIQVTTTKYKTEEQIRNL